MTSPLSAVAAALEAHRHDTVELFRALVRTPSTNPPGDTREVASIVQRYLDGAGIATELVGVDDDRTCVVARVGAQEGTVLGFNSHLDTVGVGEASDWPPGGPFCGRIDGGSVWGRGAGDAKASVAAMCVAAAVLNGIREQWSGGV